MDAQLTGFISAAQIRQTATATDALEIDVPPHHERDAQTGLGGGHAPILPWIRTSFATRSNFFSR
jgi:hypothetical protein